MQAADRRQATTSPAELSRAASLKGELLAEIAGIKTLVANCEASMQRWLAGITATAIVGISAALAGATTALIRILG